MIERQLEELKKWLRDKSPASEVTPTPLANGATLIRITQVNLGPGWAQPTANILFVAPPGYPNAAPDCFWMEPSPIRLANGATPQSTNDANPIPGDNQPGRRTTWFSWHIQGWNPNMNSLLTYYKVILDRLRPAR